VSLGSQAIVRCRVTHAGVVIELADSDAARATTAREIGVAACRSTGRAFAGVRPYVRGAAFLREVSHG
jgi:uncharacterized protein